MSKMPKYPFVPKSTAYLLPGQFWSIPLRDGRFACGRVLELRYQDGKKDRRCFLAGLMDWVGPEEPKGCDIAGSEILDHGQVHVKTISENLGQILGCRPLETDELVVPLSLTESASSPGCRVCRGYEIFDIATREERAALPTFSGWGYAVIVMLAEHHFGAQ